MAALLLCSDISFLHFKFVVHFSAGQRRSAPPGRRNGDSECSAEGFPFLYSIRSWSEHSFQIPGKKNERLKLPFDGIPAGRRRLLNSGLIQVNLLPPVCFDQRIRRSQEQH